MSIPAWRWRSGAETATWDEVTPRLVGATVTAAVVQDDETVITLQQRESLHQLELPRDTTRLPRYGGSGDLHRWQPGESHWDAWVLSQTGSL
ncbi:MAG TPA: hypothetical protein VKY74_13745 [Chloroflexia bacterium]|nr:hypothetical protein [Chloroflexia bacterium]